MSDPKPPLAARLPGLRDSPLADRASNPDEAYDYARRLERVFRYVGVAVTVLVTAVVSLSQEIPLGWRLVVALELMGAPLGVSVYFRGWIKRTFPDRLMWDARESRFSSECRWSMGIEGWLSAVFGLLFALGPLMFLFVNS